MTTLENLPAGTAQWWTDEAKGQRAERIQAVASLLWRDDEPRRAKMMVEARIYGNAAITGLGPRSYRLRDSGAANAQKLGKNVTRAVCDTYVSMVTKDRPKVSVFTSGGDRKMRRRAQELSIFNAGIFEECGTHEIAAQLELDAAEWGTGIIKTFASADEKPRIVDERVFPWEILVDHAECVGGKYQTIYQAKYVDRLRLMQEWPEKAEELAQADSNAFQETATQIGRIDDLVVVVEAWHLPRIKGSGDGLHAITCGNVLIFEEPWERRLAPFEFVYLDPPRQGIFGESFISQLMSLQRELNYLMMKIQRHMFLSAGHWMVDMGSEINTNQIGNMTASVLKYQGAMPQYNAPPAVPDQMIQYAQQLAAAMYEMAGVSQMMASAQKIPGLDTGRAQVVHADIASARMLPKYRQYQDFFKRLSRQHIELARQIQDTYGSFAVNAQQKTMMKAVKWADVNMDDEDFVLKVAATNALADDPEAQAVQIQGMINAGQIDPNVGLAMINGSMDVDAYLAHVNASKELIEDLASDIIDEGNFNGPEPFMDLDGPTGGIAFMQMEYLKAKREGVGPERLGMLIDWMAQAKAILNPPPDPNAPPPPPTPPPAMAAPMMPPPPAPMPPGMANGAPMAA